MNMLLIKKRKQKNENPPHYCRRGAWGVIEITTRLITHSLLTPLQQPLFHVHGSRLIRPIRSPMLAGYFPDDGQKSGKVEETSPFLPGTEDKLPHLQLQQPG